MSKTRVPIWLRLLAFQLFRVPKFRSSGRWLYSLYLKRALKKFATLKSLKCIVEKGYSDALSIPALSDIDLMLVFNPNKKEAMGDLALARSHLDFEKRRLSPLNEIAWLSTEEYAAISSNPWFSTAWSFNRAHTPHPVSLGVHSATAMGRFYNAYARYLDGFMFLQLGADGSMAKTLARLHAWKSWRRCLSWALDTEFHDRINLIRPPSFKIHSLEVLLPACLRTLTELLDTANSQEGSRHWLSAAKANGDPAPAWAEAYCKNLVERFRSNAPRFSGSASVRMRGAIELFDLNTEPALIAQFVHFTLHESQRQRVRWIAPVVTPKLAEAFSGWLAPLACAVGALFAQKPIDFPLNASLWNTALCTVLWKSAQEIVEIRSADRRDRWSSLLERAVETMQTIRPLEADETLLHLLRRKKRAIDCLTFS